MRKVLTFILVLTLAFVMLTGVAFAGTAEPIPDDLLSVIFNFVPAYDFIILIGLYLIGMFVKKGTNIDNKYIPLILLVPAFVFVFIFMMYFENPDFVGWVAVGYNIILAFIQAVLITAAAVYGNQIWKQLLTKSKETT